MNKDLRNKLLESYRHKAQEREARAVEPWKLEERENFLSRLKQEHKRRLLEIGAGPGKDGQFFHEQGLEVVCTDLSPEMVAMCRQKGLTAYVMDFGELQFPPQSFDAVYALNCLLHLPKNELPSVLQSIHTLLQPTGLFYLGMYGGFDYEGTRPDDAYAPKRFFTFYSDAHLQQVVATVFDILSFKQILIRDDSDDLRFQSLVLRKLTMEAGHSKVSGADQGLP